MRIQVKMGVRVRERKGQDSPEVFEAGVRDVREREGRRGAAHRERDRTCCLVGVRVRARVRVTSERIESESASVACAS